MTFDLIPIGNDVTGIANYGPTAALFTLSRNHMVQQYDVTPNQTPCLVKSAQHAPANTPPTPPTMLESTTTISSEASNLPIFSDVESSQDEGNGPMSPLAKIAQEMDSLDALESELRDKVMPLSPISSRASSVSSRSSHGSRRGRKYLYDKPDSSRASSSTGFDGTEFSFSDAVRPGHESMSIRSVSSYASRVSRPRQSFRTSNLRQELPRSPEESKQLAALDLFPYLKARVRDVAFRTPHYGNVPRTPELLQREMLSVVFGWNDDIQSLVRDELSRHRPGSASGVLLSKWLGDVGADAMASMIGSESMTSSDWMLLALSSIGQDSQKKVGEAFVQRLLEKGDIHPAVAILLGLGEFNDAIEVYVSQNYWMEAVILTCLTMPSDWGRQSWLIRKWGESAVKQGQAELAVRCFSCTSIETSEPWISPRAQQDAVYAAQQQRLTGVLNASSPQSPPNSPPSVGGSERVKSKNASLKLITTFGDRGTVLSVNQVAATPIESALSPGGQSWREKSRPIRDPRDPSSARTATPGGFGRRKRLPSKSDIDRAKREAAEMSTPMTAARDFAAPTGHSRRASASTADSIPEPTTALNEKLVPGSQSDDRLPSPGPGVFAKLQAQAKRGESRDRKPSSLASLHVMETDFDANMSPAPSTGYEGSMYTTATERTAHGTLSPPLTGNSVKARAIDEYINSVEEARTAAREQRAASRAGSRTQSRIGRAETRRRDASRAGRDQSRVREDSTTRFIKPAKRSPSSPVPMSPEEVAQAKAEPATTDDESFYKLASPVDSHKSLRSFKSESRKKRASPSELCLGVENGGNGRNGRGRSPSRSLDVSVRSPSLPPPKSPGMLPPEEYIDVKSDGRFRLRSQSTARKPNEDLQSRRAASRNTRNRSHSRVRTQRDDAMDMPRVDWSANLADDNTSEASLTMASDAGRRRPARSRKELAAKELEERRMSLARRPSAPAIPLPGEAPKSSGLPRPGMSPRSHTELGDNPHSYLPPISRSQTVDPDAMLKYNKGKSSMPAIGLPATPRAMRHPRYTGAEPSERDAPPVPDLPGNFSELSSLTGSSLSQMSSDLSKLTGSYTNSNIGSNISSSIQSAGSLPEAHDDIGPLLPSTVFGQKVISLPDRSTSAPPEKMNASIHPTYKAALPPSYRRLSAGRGQLHVAPSGPISIDEALRSNPEQQVVILPEDDDGPPPPMLPELQHLAAPAHPPPPPQNILPFHSSQGNSDVINIAIDNASVIDVPPVTLSSTTYPTTLPATTYPLPMERATTASPSLQRRGTGNMSEGFGSRFKGMTERMRSQSRGGGSSQVKAPPLPDSGSARPYETVLPPVPTIGGHMRQSSLGRAKSPYELAMSADAQDQRIPPPPPPPPVSSMAGMEVKLQETTIPPQNLPRASSTKGYRNPKEIRANMPPQSLQQGVYQSGFL